MDIDFNILRGLDNNAGSTMGDYKFLYGFISLVKPKRILDIGTNYGVSAIVMAMALRDFNLYQSSIISIDINPSVLKTANRQITRLELSRYIETRCCSSSSLEMETFFDVVFIDGGHRLEDCLSDFDNIKDKATYVLIHDTHHIDGVKRAVEIIKDAGLYEFINIDTGRICKLWSKNDVVYRSYPGIAIIKVRK